MTTPSFSADLQWLDHLANEIYSDATAIDAALKALEKVGPKTTGHKDLDHACDDFQDAWRHGLDVIRDETADVGGAVHAALANYQATETTIRNSMALTESGAPPGGSPAGKTGIGTPASSAPGTDHIREALG